MSEKPNKPTLQNPTEIAKEAFRKLALRRIAPTPDAYRDIYDEIAGITPQSSPENVLTNFAADVATIPGEAGDFGVRLNKAVTVRNWRDYQKILEQIAEYLKHMPSRTPKTSSPAPSASPTPPAPSSTSSPSSPSSPQSGDAAILQEMLARTLTVTVASLLQNMPELSQEAENLGATIKNAQSTEILTDASAKLKQLCFSIEVNNEDMAEQHELLLRLFKLLLDNISELLDDDTWLSGQIAAIQNVLSGPINHNALIDATRSLKEVIYKQGTLRQSLNEAKSTMKNMMLTFIDRLSTVATTTGDYHQKIGTYSNEISKAHDIGELNKILETVMHETETVQSEALRSHSEMTSAQQAVQEAESRINELEQKLQEMSELVREDQLTGSLNRRGLDDVFDREIARSERRKTPLCIAMLDLDNFKRLNDTYGHSAGDEVLIHLVRVVKDTLRAMDVVGRFGGEEFLIVLPDTPLEDAKQTVTRLQRELTKKIFMYNNEKLLITFSSGVALHVPGETQASLVKRADDALYEAKRAGKNRVVAAS